MISRRDVPRYFRERRSFVSFCGSVDRTYQAKYESVEWETLSHIQKEHCSGGAVLEFRPNGGPAFILQCTERQENSQASCCLSAIPRATKKHTHTQQESCTYDNYFIFFNYDVHMFYLSTDLPGGIMMGLKRMVDWHVSPWFTTFVCVLQLWRLQEWRTALSVWGGKAGQWVLALTNQLQPDCQWNKHKN